MKLNLSCMGFEEKTETVALLKNHAGRFILPFDIVIPVFNCRIHYCTKRGNPKSKEYLYFGRMHYGREYDEFNYEDIEARMKTVFSHRCLKVSVLEAQYLGNVYLDSLRMVDAKKFFDLVKKDDRNGRLLERLREASPKTFFFEKEFYLFTKIDYQFTSTRGNCCTGTKYVAGISTFEECQPVFADWCEAFNQNHPCKKLLNAEILNVQAIGDVSLV